MQEAFQNPAILNALNDRLNTLVGRPSGYIESLDPSVHRRINALLNLQDKNKEIEIQFRKELLELEKKYHQLHQPLYEERRDIIQGSKEPTDQECVREEAEEGQPKISEIKEKEEIKGIPEFWLTALKNHVAIAEMITETDEEALKHLIDIKTHHLSDNPGFKLEFIFQENDFFTDKSLFKTYFLDTNPMMPEGDLVYDHAEGSKINWKADKDLSVKIEVKKQRHKGTKETRVIKKAVSCETFFNFFKPPVIPEEEDDTELPEDFEEKLEMDYEIGESLKEKIIPRAVDWFTGKALEYEYDDEEDEDWEGDEDDFDDDDEDDDDEDDDAQDNQVNPSLNKKSKGENGEQPPECKQQ